MKHRIHPETRRLDKGTGSRLGPPSDGPGEGSEALLPYSLRWTSKISPEVVELPPAGHLGEWKSLRTNREGDQGRLPPVTDVPAHHID